MRFWKGELSPLSFAYMNFELCCLFLSTYFTTTFFWAADGDASVLLRVYKFRYVTIVISKWVLNIFVYLFTSA